MTRATEGLTVGAAAALVGVTVRALHHWDATGLVCPSARTTGGYRLYSDEDIARIQRVLIYRELGVPLDEIGGLLEASTTEPLERQREQLVERISRLQEMVEAVDRLIEAKQNGLLLSDTEQHELFGANWNPSWTTQAREQWGDTEQWAQYAERSANRTPDDWSAIAARAAALEADLATAKHAGVVPGSPEANALAERHRDAINVYFDCSLAMHVCLGRKYATDPGFAAHYNTLAPGLADWLRDIIDANALAQGIDPETATWPEQHSGP